MIKNKLSTVYVFKSCKDHDTYQNTKAQLTSLGATNVTHISSIYNELYDYRVTCNFPPSKIVSVKKYLIERNFTVSLKSYSEIMKELQNETSID